MTEGLPLPLAATARGSVGYPGKRLFDVTIATLALVVLSPILAITSWLVSRRMGRPVLFAQRAGS